MNMHKTYALALLLAAFGLVQLLAAGQALATDPIDAAMQQERLSQQQSASRRLLGLLPEEMRGSYQPLLNPPEGLERQIVKAADKLSAYIKCLEEESSGNAEFRTAAASTLAAPEDMRATHPEVGDFMDEFLPSYGRTLDELL